MSAPAPRSPTTRRTHERLVRATRAEIQDTGSFGADRVASRAGVSPATFYHYFPSKRDALVAAFGGVMADLVAFVERELSIDHLLDEGLEARCREFVDATAAFFAGEALCFRAALAALPESRALRDVYREHEAMAYAALVRFVERGQRAGAVRGGDAEAIARALLVLTQGLNNPLVLSSAENDAMRGELAHALHAFLTPGPPSEGRPRR